MLMSKNKFGKWFNNTVIDKQVHTDNVMVVTFKHPGTILNSITYTFLSHPKAIQIAGDIAPAVFYPTWNPVTMSNYSKANSGYILGKLECCRYPDNTYTNESIDQDIKDIEIDYEDNPEEFKAFKEIVEECVRHHMDNKFARAMAIYDVIDSGKYDEYFDSETICEFENVGARSNSTKLLYVEGLRVLEKYHAWDKSVNKIIVGNPEDYKI